MLGMMGMPAKSGAIFLAASTGLPTMGNMNPSGFAGPDSPVWMRYRRSGEWQENRKNIAARISSTGPRFLSCPILSPHA